MWSGSLPSRHARMRTWLRRTCSCESSWLSRLVAWRQLLTVVKPETLIRWHRKGFRLFWRLKSKPPGRPRVLAELRQLIADMAVANHTWGEERIAAELLLKLGTRRILHWNVTDHPTAEWSAQQFRMKVARRVGDDAVLWLLRVMLNASGRQGVPQGGVMLQVEVNEEKSRRVDLTQGE